MWMIIFGFVAINIEKRRGVNFAFRLSNTFHPRGIPIPIFTLQLQHLDTNDEGRTQYI